MTETNEDLAPEGDLALVFTPFALRDALRTFMALDHRMGRIVAATSEHMLGQMRLAWWRDMLGSDSATRPRGDLVLDAIGEHWSGRENALVQLVDGWEVLVACEVMGLDQLRQVAEGRSAPFVALFAEDDHELASRVRSAGMRYVCADLASRISDPDEREQAIRFGLGLELRDGRLPKAARGLAVLEALSTRALRRGGRPLLEGRGAGLAAFRAGFLGR